MALPFFLSSQRYWHATFEEVKRIFERTSRKNNPHSNISYYCNESMTQFSLQTHGCYWFFNIYFRLLIRADKVLQGRPSITGVGMRLLDNSGILYNRLSSCWTDWVAFVLPVPDFTLALICWIATRSFVLRWLEEISGLFILAVFDVCSAVLFWPGLCPFF
jgi:hypothetical protein